jgi:hypothetical protein
MEIIVQTDLKASSLLFIESEGNDINAVADSIPRAIKPVPVILAIQRPLFWSILSLQR